MITRRSGVGETCEPVLVTNRISFPVLPAWTGITRGATQAEWSASTIRVTTGLIRWFAQTRSEIRVWLWTATVVIVVIAPKRTMKLRIPTISSGRVKPRWSASLALMGTTPSCCRCYPRCPDRSSERSRCWYW